MAKLLISDCYPKVADSLKGLFTALGLSAQTADNAENIIKTVETNKPDVVVMDVRLNNKRRWDVVEKIKRMSPNIKIIIMSTYSYSDISDDLKKYDITRGYGDAHKEAPVKRKNPPLHLFKCS